MRKGMLQFHRTMLFRQFQLNQLGSSLYRSHGYRARSTDISKNLFICLSAVWNQICDERRSRAWRGGCFGEEYFLAISRGIPSFWCISFLSSDQVTCVRLAVGEEFPLVTSDLSQLTTSITFPCEQQPQLLQGSYKYVVFGYIFCDVITSCTEFGLCFICLVRLMWVR